ncbi:MAG: PAS domain-containing protein [Candidatus Syntropharchaeales archaeon]
MKADADLFAKIIGAIQGFGETGATVDEISKAVSLERHTLSKYMNLLRADGRVSYKQIGRARVWFISKSPLQHVFGLSEEDKTYTEKVFSRILSDMPEGILILDFDYNILFANRYLTTLYGNCVGKKFYQTLFNSSQDVSGISALIEGVTEELESCVEDKEGRMLEIKARREKNPDSSFSIIAIIRDVTEKVLYERQIKNLSELQRLLGESVNRSYTIDELASTILKNLCDVIRFNMGDILIYDPTSTSLSTCATIGYPDEPVPLAEEVEEWKRKIALVTIQRRANFYFNFDHENTNKDEIVQAACRLARVYDLQEIHSILLKTKGEIHGVLLILTRAGRSLSREDRSLLEGLSEMIAGGIAKIKAEEEWKLKTNVLDILAHPIFVITMEGILAYVNPAFLKMWGYDRESEVLGRYYTKFWKEDAKDAIHALRQRGKWEGELLAVRRDGSEFNARLSASLIMGKKGPLQLIGILEFDNGN